MEVPMNIFAEWPHKFYGVWKFEPNEAIEVPLFCNLVDPSWNPEDLAQIVHYLENCQIVITCGIRPAPCRICGEMLSRGTQRSDGEWTWMGTLGHFVAKHHIRLPDMMVTHIRSRL